MAKDTNFPNSTHMLFELYCTKNVNNIFINFILQLLNEFRNSSLSYGSFATQTSYSCVKFGFNVEFMCSAITIVYYDRLSLIHKVQLVDGFSNENTPKYVHSELHSIEFTFKFALVLIGDVDRFDR